MKNSGLIRDKDTVAEGVVPCFHCGEDSRGQEIRAGEKVFCCVGCRTVYEILEENGLCRYYDIEATPGWSLKGRKQVQYAWLDEPAIAAQIVDFQDANMARVSFYLPQIHCSSCIWLLENLYKLHEGVLTSKVNFLKREVHLTYSREHLSLRQVVELLDSIGYAPEINLGDLGKEKKEGLPRSFYYKLGLAGFGFGNIMLLSFPEYLGLDAASESWFHSWFSWLNILLAAPVVFYSGQDYLRSAFVGLRKGNWNIDVPIALGMMALLGRSLYEILLLGEAGYLDSLAGFIFFLLIGRWFQRTTYHHLSFERDYRSYFPVSAALLEGGKERSVPITHLKEGDRVLVRNQELIPADGVLRKGRCRIDYSFVTGESEPVEETAGAKVFAGGRQMGAPVEIELTKAVDQSYLIQLWDEEAFRQENTTKAGRLADTLGKYFTFAILTIAAFTLLYWLPKDAGMAFRNVTAVLIIACPCALALSIPFTFGNALRILARRGFFLKNTASLERLANISTIVLDKTGTITMPQASTLHFEGEPLSAQEKQCVKALAHHSSHPMSRRIEEYLQVPNGLEVGAYNEIPGKGLSGKVAGHQIRLGSRNYILGAASQNGLLQKGSFVEIDGVFKGVFQLKGIYRRGLKGLLGHWGQRYDLYLLSGDHEGERQRLAPLFPSEDSLHFNQTPKEKLAFVRDLQDAGEQVLMLGDGLNDAGALKQSDIGIVITENTANFIPASDGILDARQFEGLDRFLRYAKHCLYAVYAAFGLAFLYNVIGLTFAVQGLLSPVVAAILMPLSSISIVIFGVVSSSLLSSKMKAVSSKS